jgi:uncharacterized protein (TIGR00266 family)
MATSNVSGLNYEILYRGSFAMLQVSLPQGTSIKAEAGAMVGMSDTVDVDGRLDGGILGGLGRMFAGEKFFFQTLAARRGEGVVFMSPSMPGDILPLELDGNTTYMVAKDGFLASNEEVQIDTGIQNLAQGIFSGEGFFVLKVHGRGTLFLSSYGAIDEVTIPAGESFIFDNGHLVAWPANMRYTIEKASGGWISSITSGECLVCRFHGPGKVYFQSRNVGSFISWLQRLMPSKR